MTMLNSAAVFLRENVNRKERENEKEALYNQKNLEYDVSFYLTLNPWSMFNSQQSLLISLRIFTTDINKTTFCNPLKCYFLNNHVHIQPWWLRSLARFPSMCT